MGLLVRLGIILHIPELNNQVKTLEQILEKGEG